MKSTDREKLIELTAMEAFRKIEKILDEYPPVWENRSENAFFEEIFLGEIYVYYLWKRLETK